MLPVYKGFKKKAVWRYANGSKRNVSRNDGVDTPGDKKTIVFFA